MTERSVLTGWVENPNKPGEYSAGHTFVPVTQQFANFVEQSRARWDSVEWLKVKLRQLSNKKTPTK